jgi:predicted component of type VI protein secretion system
MQSTGSYRLTVRQGPVPGKVFELAKDVVTIGRDVNNDLAINDAEISRNHGRLTSQSGGYLIEDLASTNGTFVNGQRLIGPKLLNPGDVVGLGETIVLEYSYIADAGATVVASAPAPRMMEEPPTAPPQMPQPAPMPMMVAEPPPMMAPEPMLATGSNASPMISPEPIYNPMPAAPPPPPMAMPPVPAKPNNTVRYVGIGCGCLLLCACLAAVAYYAINSGVLKQFGL